MLCRRTWIACVAALLLLGLFATIVRAGADGEIKWSQPPIYVQDNFIYGWDEVSMVSWPIVADDFKCEDPRPVTDLHWWGSYPQTPAGAAPQHPDGFLIRFWTDVPAGADPNPNIPWSHPGQVLHEIECRNFQWEPVGYDVDPLEWDSGTTVVVDECFQYNQALLPDEHFQQDFGTIYWLSIQAIYDDPAVDEVWGWKTRPHFFNDDAAIGHPSDLGGPIIWEPIMDATGRSWDMAFELTVPEPSTIAMLLSVVGGLLLVGWRKRRG